MNQQQTTQQIETIITDVNNIIRNGVSKMLFDHTVNYLTNELEKCKTEMEYYKTELEKVKKQQEPSSSSSKENIVLKIEDIKPEIKSEYEKPTIEKTVLAPKSVHNLVIVDDESCDNNVCNETKENGETDEEDEETVSSLEEEEEVEEEEVEEGEVEEEEVEEEIVASLEEEEVVEEEEEEVEEEEVVEEENDAEEEVFEIEIDDVTYYTENEENGNIYAVDADGNPGNKIGYLKDGEPFFY